MKRPRRSHQCRGKRARNYVRALARVNARRAEHGEPGHPHMASASTVLADAHKSGALASHRRQEAKREKWAKGRKHD